MKKKCNDYYRVLKKQISLCDSMGFHRDRIVHFVKISARLLNSLEEALNNNDKKRIESEFSLVKSIINEVTAVPEVQWDSITDDWWHKTVVFEKRVFDLVDRICATET